MDQSTKTESSPLKSSATQSKRPVTLPPLPELYQPFDQVLDALLPVSSPERQNVHKSELSAPAKASNPFMTALKAVQNRTTTWNLAGAYKSTLSPTLDAFSSLSQNTSPDDIADLLAKSWNADPEITLKIIWNLRSIHEGKSARMTFYRAYAWLYANHPRTAVANLKFLVESCVKRTIRKTVKGIKADNSDMEVLTLADYESAAEKKANENSDMEVLTLADYESTTEKKANENSNADGDKEEITIGMPHGYWKDLLNILLLAATDELIVTSSFNALNVPKVGRGAVPVESSSDPAKARLEKHIRWHNIVTSKLQSDQSFRALYIAVARLFADALTRDLDILREMTKEDTSPERRLALSYDLTLVGKWAPSIGGSHDRVTNIATAISEVLYAGGQFPFPASEPPISQETAHKLRAAYTHWVISPLRRALEIPEIAMSAGQWDKVKYTRVPSKCMQTNKDHFAKRDNARFSRYLLDVAQGKKKISGATLLPNDMLYEAIRSLRDATQSQVINAQWKTMVERVKESGKLDNAIAVCDVSGSMGSLYGSRGSPNQPIFPAVALSILLAQVAQPPWSNTFITFSATPQIISLNPEDDLAKMVSSMTSTEWGMNTDFDAVFTKLLLPLALEHKLKPEDMVKRIFVFSDMQFDDSRASSGSVFEKSWKSEHQTIKKKFEKAGYQLPELVYWNLAGNVAKPVTKDDEGVALVSGFSPGMLKVFLERGAPNVDEEEFAVIQREEGEEKTTVENKSLDPVDTMLAALGKESFAGLQVFD